eukprot:COSAG05_NODE_3659_length_1923_cov_563.266447_3_plen_119_part_00
MIALCNFLIAACACPVCIYPLQVYANIYSDPRGIREPNSKFSMVWDVLQIIFLLSVCYFVPIRACFSVEVELWSGEFWWDVIVDIYFIVDLVINFRTAIYNDKGVLVTDSALLLLLTR